VLESWRVAGFKSVAEETTLELAPLTVFAGANSSGKSTIIQSMLLTAQTLQSAVYGRPVVLNGHMARLGSFDDIVSFGDESRDIEIAFSLRVSRENARLANEFSSRRAGRLYFAQFARATQVDCAYSFSVKGGPEEIEILRLQPQLESSWLRVSLHADPQPLQDELGVVRSSMSLGDRLGMFKLSHEVINRAEASALEFQITRFPKQRSRSGLGPGSWTQLAGAVFAHFLPSSLAVVFDAVEAEAQRILSYLTSRVPGRAAEFGYYADALPPLNQRLVNVILETLRDALSQAASNYLRGALQEATNQFAAAPGAEALNALFARAGGTEGTRLSHRFTERADAILTAARDGRQPRYEIRFEPLPDIIGAGVATVSEFFAESVKYLGPLRDEPKPVYPLAGSTDPRDVGFRGEHTAAVLHLHQRTSVSFVEAKAFAQAGSPIRLRTATLAEAVLDWLVYMGVGSQVDTEDLGKLGHQLKISVGAEGLQHDLTQVGVGVSQVLPILVLSLLAPQGSTLIFEQPELHLHPRVQTRLADFFVAMNASGKQCIVETHSEYLINRLRYLAAVSAGDEVAKSVMMYFVEKTHGRSSYRRIEMNQFGVIEDWPSGFFDESEANAAAILRAGLDKRKR
jgi:predicted ATPase